MRQDRTFQRLPMPCVTISRPREKRGPGAWGLRPEGRGDSAMTRKDTWVDSPCGSDMSSTRSTLGASDYSKTGKIVCIGNHGREGCLEMGRYAEY